MFPPALPLQNVAGVSDHSRDVSVAEVILIHGQVALTYGVVEKERQSWKLSDVR